MQEQADGRFGHILYGFRTHAYRPPEQNLHVNARLQKRDQLGSRFAYVDDRQAARPDMFGQEILEHMLRLLDRTVIHDPADLGRASDGRDDGLIEFDLGRIIHAAQERGREHHQSLLRRFLQCAGQCCRIGGNHSASLTDDFREQFLFAPEVAVDRALGNTGFVRHLVHGRRSKTGAKENPLGCNEHDVGLSLINATSPWCVGLGRGIGFALCRVSSLGHAGPSPFELVEPLHRLTGNATHDRDCGAVAPNSGRCAKAGSDLASLVFGRRSEHDVDRTLTHRYNTYRFTVTCGYAWSEFETEAKGIVMTAKLDEASARQAEIERIRANMIKTQYFLVLRESVVPALKQEALLEHYQWLIELEKRGEILISGAVARRDGSMAEGMTILRADSFEEAEALAASDPAVANGATSFRVERFMLGAGRVTVAIDFSDKTYRLE